MHTQSHRQDPDLSPFYFFSSRDLTVSRSTPPSLSFSCSSFCTTENHPETTREKEEERKKLDLCFFRIVSEIAVLKCACAGPVVGENLHKLPRGEEGNEKALKTLSFFAVYGNRF